MLSKTDSMLWFILLLLWPTTKSAATGSNIAKPDCPEKCGEVDVPYPFGIEENCALNNLFLLECNHNSSSPKLLFGRNTYVLDISVENGTIFASLPTAYRCYNDSGGVVNSSDIYIILGAGHFRISDTRNKLTAFGCDTLAAMSDTDGSFVSGCLSVCSADSISVNITQHSCSGIGCCQTPLPQSLETLNISLGSINNHTGMGNFKPCDYAILADETFDITSLKLSDEGQDGFITSNITIEWVAKEEACERSRNSADYACASNTDCIYSENGQGYRCLCKQGFQGNPDLGCYDIDECKEPTKYKCDGTCKNTIGNYTCHCPLGKHGDGKVGCEELGITKIFTIIGAIIFTVIVGVMILIISKERRKERNFLKNGGIILKHQRVRIFKAPELEKATKNYDGSQLLGEGGFGSVYKGVLPDNTLVAVKKPKEEGKIKVNQEFQQELGIVSQVNHKNVVKILGLCLETKVPLLVYEFVSNGTLSHHIHDKSSQILGTWKTRLRIAVETAHALDYFHSLASPPIIHGDVKSTNILLDESYTEKVADFGASVLISPDQTAMATKIQGTFGYLDPEYLMSGILSEKSDVYSYGVVLVELLTGLKLGLFLASNNQKINMVHYFLCCIENNSLFQVLGFKVANKSEMEEIQIVAEVAKKCVSSSGIQKPTMKEVAEELDRLKKLHDNLWDQENSEETDHLLGEPSSNFKSEHSAAVISQQDKQTEISFDIEKYSYTM
ncbi:putative Kinase [Melia azedarach]|uniref:Kinase n=1 Tax=Melia azedarach TaxID=155640 RepID=A0ACC1YNT5_MELAZ|nr:putative Kinase [Melia azedarach]